MAQNLWEYNQAQKAREQAAIDARTLRLINQIVNGSDPAEQKVEEIRMVLDAR